MLFRSAPSKAAAMKKLPAWVIHGDHDDKVPLSKSLAMYKALREVKGNVRLTVLPDTGHNAWSPLYKDPAFYKWLLKHKMTDKRSAPDKAYDNVRY